MFLGGNIMSLFDAIFLGVVTAGIIMSVISFGVDMLI